jgi:anti-sigma factor RsiW
MNCQEAKNLIQAYGDGELDAPHSLAVESHLRDCASCAAVQRRQQALKTALGSEALQFKMPAGLRKTIVTELRQTVRPEPRPPFWTAWLFPFSATAVASLVIGFLLAGGLNRAPVDQLAGEIASSHARSLMANHLMDVASTDQHTVKPWLDARIDFAPPVKDFATNGFPLIGGRLDYIDTHTTAALVYKRGGHFINLFIWPVTAADETPRTAATQRGYHLIHWTSSGMTFWAASDLNEKELMQFCEEFRGN